MIEQLEIRSPHNDNGRIGWVTPEQRHAGADEAIPEAAIWTSEPLYLPAHRCRGWDFFVGVSLRVQAVRDSGRLGQSWADGADLRAREHRCDDGRAFGAFGSVVCGCERAGACG